VAEINLQKVITLLSEPSCISVGADNKQKAFSNYSVVVDNLFQNVREELRKRFSDIFENENSYGKDVTIELHCILTDPADLSRNKISSGKLDHLHQPLV
jgi:hypothetical protein